MLLFSLSGLQLDQFTSSQSLFDRVGRETGQGASFVDKMSKPVQKMPYFPDQDQDQAAMDIEVAGQHTTKPDHYHEYN
ncbi:hypothetical protein ACMAZH_05775 [Arenicellales bacterium nBUS_45]